MHRIIRNLNVMLLPHQEKLLNYSEFNRKIEFRRINEPIGLFGIYPSQNDFAHKSDCARMNILLARGGIYLDSDVLVLRSFDDLRNYSLVLGFQTDLDVSEICNGIILASKHSPFLTAWYNLYRTVKFQECWDCHSVKLPSNLLKSKPHLYANNTRVLPIEAFYDPSFSRSDARELFVENKDPNHIPRLYPPYEGKYAQVIEMRNVSMF